MKRPATEILDIEYTNKYLKSSNIFHGDDLFILPQDIQRKILSEFKPKELLILHANLRSRRLRIWMNGIFQGLIQDEIGQEMVNEIMDILHTPTKNMYATGLYWYRPDKNDISSYWRHFYIATLVSKVDYARLEKTFPKYKSVTITKQLTKSSDTVEPVIIIKGDDYANTLTRKLKQIIGFWEVDTLFDGSIVYELMIKDPDVNTEISRTKYISLMFYLLFKAGMSLPSASMYGFNTTDAIRCHICNKQTTTKCNVCDIPICSEMCQNKLHE